MRHIFTITNMINNNSGTDYSHGMRSIFSQRVSLFLIATVICAIVELILYMILVKEKKKAFKMSISTNLLLIILGVLILLMLH